MSIGLIPNQGNSTKELVTGSLTELQGLLVETYGESDEVQTYLNTVAEEIRAVLGELGTHESLLEALSEREIEGAILRIFMELTNAEAGTLYLLEGEGENQQLRSIATHNDALPKLQHREYVLPVDEESTTVAGHCILRREALRVKNAHDLPKPVEAAPGELSFDRGFDERSGYRTQSILCIPLRGEEGELLGCVQLINRKDEDKQTVSFRTTEIETVESKIPILIPVISNTILRERKNDAVIKVLIKSIESKDPNTAGHSERVTKMAANAAEVLGLSPKEKKSFIQGARLHDIGKAGVPAEILTKQRKLFDHELEAIEERFQTIIQLFKLQLYEKAERDDSGGIPKDQLERIKREAEAFRTEVETDLAAIKAINQPNPRRWSLSEREREALEGQIASDQEKIGQIATKTYYGLDGNETPFLTEREIECLNIKYGSLTASEMEQIREHPERGWELLRDIPGMDEIILNCTRLHHAKLNRHGYPAVNADKIPRYVRMLTIIDMYDAMTTERGYRPEPLTHDETIAELRQAADEGAIDRELLDLFIQHEMWIIEDHPVALAA